MSGGREYPEQPVVGVGGVVVRDTAVLLVERAHEPSAGQWSLPGGAVELGETLEEAVVRRAARGDRAQRPGAGAGGSLRADHPR